MLVPELIHVLALPCLSLSIQSVIAVPYGGDANPVLAPANRTPKPSTHTLGDTPMMINPTIARAPAIRTMTRGPLPTVKTVERRSEEHTSELQSRFDLVCRLLLEKKKT